MKKNKLNHNYYISIFYIVHYYYRRIKLLKIVKKITYLKRILIYYVIGN